MRSRPHMDAREGSFARIRPDAWIATAYVTRDDARELARELLGPRAVVSDEDTSDAFVRSADGDVCATARGTRFTRLRGRRCVSFGGVVNARVTLSRDDFPPLVRKLMQRVSTSAGTLVATNDAPDESMEKMKATTSFMANHALVNIYDETEGIMPHEDGPLYRDVVCIVSIGASRVIQFTPKQTGEGTTSLMAFDVFLPHRSLFVFTGEAYCSYLHAIKSGDRFDEKSASSINVENFPPGCDVVERQGYRISLTFRQVLNARRAPAFLTKPRT
ncbi:Alpha-ketoglutarate-dependent dioxygenase AlkB-like [Ostreococcus tauri]|uniref:Alpha-ketoglutarate-dependent dioxygenase AlkB-like n=1 Tax=Ostreococcus tauri TaxID=70448 RepID=A0A090M413_OSTTA|nr:Alpha-ketoglutarate-dependent dioxygenase AlkB-like [Ostreococcus tauri]CEF97392.1 Alpha-ketoglutarate-dependent dioxygenase AlkB-like [Ostreococcus tauri]|eukprot:XP_003078520.2 Alpha-ketoglutarate-dependent dioxygenase AlkB-like [Ostreococcus tauri]